MPLLVVGRTSCPQLCLEPTGIWAGWRWGGLREDFQVGREGRVIVGVQAPFLALVQRQLEAGGWWNDLEATEGTGRGRVR